MCYSYRDQKAREEVREKAEREREESRRREERTRKHDETSAPRRERELVRA